jgi:hypothetical protein
MTNGSKQSFGRGRFETGEWGLTAPAATILAALMALIGGVAGAAISGYFGSKTSISVEQKKADAAIKLEQKKFEINLILKAVVGQNQDTAAKTLRFFADLGFIPTYEKQIRTLDLKDIPSIGLSLQETAASRTSSFTYITSPAEIDPGRREWKRVGDDHWTESYPHGQVSSFTSKTRIVLYGCSGTAVANDRETNFQVFVPDRNCPSAALWFRRVDTNGDGIWAYLQPIIDVK